MPAESDKISVSSTATTLSDKSTTDTLVGDGSTNSTATAEGNPDVPKKATETGPSKPALDPLSPAKPSPSKPTAERPSKASASRKGLEPFLYANWGWGGPPCIDFPTAETRRERQQWERER